MKITKKEFLEALETQIPDDADITGYSIKVAVTQEIASMSTDEPQDKVKGRKRAPFSRRSSKSRTPAANDQTDQDPKKRITERDIRAWRTYLNIAESTGKLDEDHLDTWLELKDLKARAMSDIQKERIKKLYDVVKEKDRAF